MKRIFLFLLLVSYLTGNKSIAQLVYQQKTWQQSISATVGINYNDGHDFQGLYTLRINSSPFFVSGGLTIGSEKITVASVSKKPVNLHIIQLSGAYSIFDKISPAPFNVAFFGGIINTNEKIDLRDGVDVTNNTFGNVAGVHFEWYCLRYISVVARQNLFFLYKSPFGKFRANSSLGISFNF